MPFGFCSGGANSSSATAVFLAIKTRTMTSTSSSDNSDRNISMLIDHCSDDTTSSNGPIDPKIKKKSTLSVKFEFPIRGTEFAAPTIHKEIIETIEKSFPDVTISSNKHDTTFIKASATTDEEFLSHFNYQSFPRSNHRRVCFAHDIITAASFQDVRNAARPLLVQYNGFLRINPWSETELDIVNVGWIYCAHPKIHHRLQIESLINSYCELKKIENIPVEIFPKTITSYSPENERLTTNAIHFACLNKNSINAKNMLQACFSDPTSLLPGTFIPSDLASKQGANVLAKYVKHQNAYLHNHRSIVLHGICPSDLHESFHYNNSDTTLFKLAMNNPHIDWLSVTKFSDQSGKLIMSTTTDKYLPAITWIDTTFLPTHHKLPDRKQPSKYHDDHAIRSSSKQYSNDQYTKSLASNISDITDSSFGNPIRNAWTKPLTIVTKASNTNTTKSPITVTHQSTSSTLTSTVESLITKINTLQSEHNSIKANHSKDIASAVEQALERHTTKLESKFNSVIESINSASLHTTNQQSTSDTIHPFDSKIDAITTSLEKLQQHVTNQVTQQNQLLSTIQNLVEETISKRFKTIENDVNKITNQYIAIIDQLNESWSGKFQRLHKTKHSESTSSTNAPGSGSDRARKQPRTIANLNAVQRNLFQSTLTLTKKSTETKQSNESSTL